MLNIRKITTLVMSLVILCMAFMPSAFAVSDLEKDSLTFFLKDQQVIASYYKIFNERDLKTSAWTTKNAPLSSSYINSLNESTTNDDQSGLDNIISMNNPVVLSQIPINDYEEYCEGIDNPALYLVRVDGNVVTDDGFNFDGTNYHVIICGTQDGTRVVFDSRLPMPHLINEYEPNVALGNAYLMQRFEGITYKSDATIQDSDDPISFNTVKPSSIKVKRTEYGNGVISTVNFLSYCKNVALYEIGYNSWDSDALKAGALAIRNFGWHKVLTASTSDSYHVEDNGAKGGQTYNPGGGRSESSYPNVISAMNAIWNVQMVNSSKKLFLSEYSRGTENKYGEQNCGYLRHWGAKRHADDGRSYSYILNWYYGSSKRSSGSIIVCGSHTYGSAWVKNANQHYKACTKCGNHGSIAAHSWVLSSDKTKYTCSVCGYSTTNAGGIMAISKGECFFEN